MLRQMYVLWLFAMILLPALGQAAVVMSKSIDSYTDSKKKPFGISLTGTLNSSTDKPDSYHHSVSSSLALDANYKFKNKIKLEASLVFDKELDGLRENTFRNSYLGISRKIVKSKNVFSMSANAGAIFPTNQDKRELDGYRGGAKVGAGVSYKFDKVGLKGLTASWGVGFVRNFYRYTYNRSGKVNSQASLGHKVKLSYELNKLTFAFVFKNTSAWSYSNKRLNDKFSMTQDISYTVNDNVLVSVGHTNAANSFQANGTDSNIELYDPLNSTVYVSAGLSY